jgi:preprotein translocase subunit SecA
LISRMLVVSKPLAVRAHFPYVEWRRVRLEKHRRNRRMKLLKSEEKHNELLAFTRAD